MRFVRRSRSLAVLALTAACTAAAPAAGPLRPGQPAPPFALRSLDGKMVSPAAYRGKPLYINFFASWCAPCREETPAIVKFAKAYAKRGLVVIGIDDQEIRDRASDFHDQYKIEYPVLVGDEKTVDAYGAIALPVHVFVDRRGIVKQYRLGEMSPAEIETAIKSIL